MQIDIKVLGGLPVTVEFDAIGADPECGYMSDYVEDWSIVAINSRTVKKCDWLYKRIEAAKEEEKILLACCESLYDTHTDF